MGLDALTLEVEVSSKLAGSLATKRSLLGLHTLFVVGGAFLALSAGCFSGISTYAVEPSPPNSKVEFTSYERSAHRYKLSTQFLVLHVSTPAALPSGAISPQFWAPHPDGVEGHYRIAKRDDATLASFSLPQLDASVVTADLYGVPPVDVYTCASRDSETSVVFVYDFDEERDASAFVREGGHAPLATVSYQTGYGQPTGAALAGASGVEAFQFKPYYISPIVGHQGEENGTKSFVVRPFYRVKATLRVTDLKGNPRQGIKRWGLFLGHYGLSTLSELGGGNYQVEYFSPNSDAQASASLKLFVPPS